MTSRANALIETVRIDANQAITEAKVEMENVSVCCIRSVVGSLRVAFNTQSLLHLVQLKEQMVQAREGKLAAESKLEDAIVELAHEQEKCKEAVRYYLSLLSRVVHSWISCVCV